MKKPGDGIAHDVARRYLKKLLLSNGFRKAQRCKRIVEILYESCPEAVSPADLATALKLPMTEKYEEKSKNLVRVAVMAIRSKLLAYDKDHAGEPVTFEISTEDGYRLDVLTRTAPRTVYVQLSFANRNSNWLETIVQEESKTVLFASISSCHTLDRIRPWFDQGLVKTEHFRVLTWWPASKDALATWTDNSGENVERMASNIKSAWEGWRELQEAKDFVEVYRYASVPTMQSICNDRYLKLELLPFNRKGDAFHECGATDHRPAIVMSAEDDAAAYHFFKNSFEDLWITAMKNAPQEDIHPKWHHKRQQLLARLGLIP